MPPSGWHELFPDPAPADAILDRVIHKAIRYAIKPYSRPGKPLIGVKGVAIHWVTKPGTTALANRNYLEGLKNQAARYASAHFIIGLRGEVIQWVLENGVAYHVGAERYSDIALKNLSSYPNNCTLEIELCHTNWEGEFTRKPWNRPKGWFWNFAGGITLAAPIFTAITI
jgi:N-acetylmuramoyl-L-alanine amidase CwlA